jgi:hypothetical protein
MADALIPEATHTSAKTAKAPAQEYLRLDVGMPAGVRFIS